MKKVSIIVPVYNTSNFLEKCMDSIIKQTLKEIEIIVINDGSTDNSLDICKAYAAKDCRVVLIDQENRGLSATRNKGVQAAKGEYVGFVDSDDWIEADMFEKMYLQAKESEAEVCLCNYKVNYMEESVPVALDIEKDVMENNEIFSDIVINLIGPKDLNSNNKNIMACVWRMIIKKELLEKNNIIFLEDITFMEDILYSLEVYSKCNKVCINRGYFYNYMLNTNSITMGYKENCKELSIKVYTAMKNILERDYDYSILENRMDIRYFNMLLSSIINEVRKNNPKTLLTKIKNINSICNDANLKRILYKLELKSYNFKKRAVLFAMKHRAGFYLYTYYRLGMKFSKSERR